MTELRQVRAGTAHVAAQRVWPGVPPSAAAVACGDPHACGRVGTHVCTQALEQAVRLMSGRITAMEGDLNTLLQNGPALSHTPGAGDLDAGARIKLDSLSINLDKNSAKVSRRLWVLVHSKRPARTTPRVERSSHWRWRGMLCSALLVLHS